MAHLRLSRDSVRSLAVIVQMSLAQCSQRVENRLSFAFIPRSLVEVLKNHGIPACAGKICPELAYRPEFSTG